MANLVTHSLGLPCRLIWIFHCIASFSTDVKMNFLHEFLT